MTTSPLTKLATYRYFIEEMDCADCADCARTVEGAIGRIGGVGDASVSFTTQTLRLTLDEAHTPRTELAGRLRSLGCPPTLLREDIPETKVSGPMPPAAATAWYSSAKGRTVLATGGLLALSTLLALVFPPLAQSGFTAATLIGVAPLARKALASTRLGSHSPSTP